MKKFFSLFLALVMVLMIAAGCSSKSANEGVNTGSTSSSTTAGQAAQTQQSTEKIKLRVASMTSFGNGMEENQKIFNTYTDTHPNVQVVLEEVADATGSDWNGYVAKLQTMVAAGTAPDVCDMATEGMQLINKNKLALPLDEYLNKHTDIRDETLSDVNPVLYKPFTIDGKIYSLMTMWNNCITHINLDRFKEAGVEVPSENWTKDDFLATCAKLSTSGQNKYAVLVPAYYFAASAWLFSFDASFLNEDMSAAAVNSPNAVECFQFMHDLIYKYKYAPVPQPSDDYVQLLIDGKVAMMEAGRWPCATYTANNFTNVAVQYNPSFKKKANVYGTEGFIVMNGTKHYEEAAEFCVWGSSKDFISKFVKSGSCPARTSIGREIVEGLGYPQNAKVYFDSLDANMKSVEAPVAYADIANAFDTYFSMMMTDPNANIKAICDKMANDINAAIAKNK